MTLGQALVTRAAPYMLAEKAKALAAIEVGKGCSGDILPHPVALEPSFAPITLPKDIIALEDRPCWVPENQPSEQDLARYRVWISPEQPFDWNCCELLIKQLYLVSNRVGLEITGNQKGINIAMLCHKQDIPVVTTAFRGKLKLCRLSPLEHEIFPDLGPDAWKDVRLYDLFPIPPYYHLLTRPNELHTSPYECLFAAMANIPKRAMGIYQVLFQPVSPEHDWHRNVQNLKDLEYVVKLFRNVGHSQRYGQQAPSGDLRNMAGQVETKAHNDKPLYAAAFRIAVLGADSLAQEYLQSLAVFSSLLQHGGRPLQSIGQADYKRLLSPRQLCQMFQLGLTFRPGFLVNSAELAGLVHFPPATIVEHLDVSIDTVDTLALNTDGLSEGTPVGTCDIAGRQQLICIPQNLRIGHTHLIGKPGSGKSTVKEHMIIDDIKKGGGVAVLDPHGDLAERLLALIPEEYIDRVIYFDPGDPYWVPIWNPLQRVPGQDIGRMADDLVGVLKSFVSGWGDRLEHILRHSIFALLHLSGSTLMDIANLLRSGSKDSETTRKLILDVVENEEARKFWEHDFLQYRPDEFTPPKHKLSKMLVGGTISLMLSQPKSSFNFRRIMDDGMIFIANLSGLGTEMRQILGGFVLAILYVNALSRSEIPREQRKLFNIYLDEAHKFVTDSLEDVIAETPKYAVNMTLAHQFMRQFGAQKIDAISSVGTTIVFNVDTKDATYLAKDFHGLVEPDDIINLEKWEAIMRCGTDVVRLKTLPPLQISPDNCRDRIIARSREKYCAPAPQVHQTINQPGKQAKKLSQSFSAPVDDNEKPDENGNWDYEEF